jgi:hypothetical protein
MDADKLGVIVVKFIVGGWIIFRLGGGVTICCRKKKHKKEGEMGEGEGGDEGRSIYHKLNIIDDIIDKIILSIKIPCHCTICPFESHCNILYNSLRI